MTDYVSYKRPDGFDYFQDVELDPADLASGLVLSRLDPTNFPSSGHVAAALFSDPSKLSPWLSGTSVTSVTVTPGVGEVTVTWTEPKHVEAPTSYVVSAFNAQGIQVANSHAGGQSFTLAGLPAGDYRVTIVPLDELGHSMGITATTPFTIAGPPPPPPIQPYGTPSSFTATLNPDQSVTFNWAPMAEVYGYHLGIAGAVGDAPFHVSDFGSTADGSACRDSTKTLSHSELATYIGGSANVYFSLCTNGRWISPYNSDAVRSGTVWAGPIHV